MRWKDLREKNHDKKSVRDTGPMRKINMKVVTKHNLEMKD